MLCQLIAKIEFELSNLGGLGRRKWGDTGSSSSSGVRRAIGVGSAGLRDLLLDLLDKRKGKIDRKGL